MKTPPMNDNAAYRFYREVLGSPKYIVAPMVEQSELAWRLLSKRHGAQLCYSPMLHAEVFSRNENYRNTSLVSCAEDSPLIIQFCASNAESLLKAALLAQDHCVAIDLNLGCPQGIARKGHYGVFLQEEWSLIHDMVKTCAENLRVPITCKCRVFPDVEKTVRYAKMLEAAGCKILTVHGRTDKQKGAHTGLADWSQIKAVKEAISIPVFANGNIQYHEDVERCLRETGADGVMSAEGQLHDPTIFEPPSTPVNERMNAALTSYHSASTGGTPLAPLAPLGPQSNPHHRLASTAWRIAEEYLRIVDEYPTNLGIVRGHLFKLFHHSLQIHLDIRKALGDFKTMSGMKEVVAALIRACQEDEQKEDQHEMITNVGLPHWTCQPYVRPHPVDTQQMGKGVPCKRNAIGAEDLSKNMVKRLKRNPNIEVTSRPGCNKSKYDICDCGNPLSLKCTYRKCRACCKRKRIEEKAHCDFHKFPAKNGKFCAPEVLPRRPATEPLACEATS